MADLILKPDFVFEEGTEYKTLSSEFENGCEQRRAKWSSSLKTWNLQYKNRSTTEKDIVQALFDSKKGSFMSFTWEHTTTGVIYTVKFKEDKLTPRSESPAIWNFEFSLVQVK